ncbi:glycosyltransferase family 4 protein [Candidatus Woesearchaeota archaeon]|nr:glycosyltransferase family 4 protein [Candidatus Woesearchaeota archaeon]
MKVLMFGWEFPPFKSGGLGTACYDLTKGLSRQGVDVTFVMPVAPEDANAQFVKLLGANNFAKKVKVRKISSVLQPYQSFTSYSEALKHIKSSAGVGSKGNDIYGTNLYEEVYRYGMAGREIAEEEEFDVIHVHDWMTYQAGINAKRVSGKPLVAHIHATEFDRTGGNPNQIISHLEYTGLKAADIVIANSNFTKQNVIQHYSIDPGKIKVVHWGIEPDNPHYGLGVKSPFRDEKVVLFLGRITIQKGPDYFIEAAGRVLKYLPNTKFVVAGSGDMFERMINRADELGILHNFIFTGFLKGADVHRAFQMADLYVMPSVSEPFGLVALESMKNGTPIMISKQSGVSEVVNHALKVDFWDVDEMANKMVNVLKYSELLEELNENSFREVQKFNLDEPARKTKSIYEEAIAVRR